MLIEGEVYKIRKLIEFQTLKINVYAHPHHFDPNTGVELLEILEKIRGIKWTKKFS